MVLCDFCWKVYESIIIVLFTLCALGIVFQLIPGKMGTIIFIVLIVLEFITKIELVEE